jgi:hypothetical protein
MSWKCLVFGVLCLVFSVCCFVFGVWRAMTLCSHFGSKNVWFHAGESVGFDHRGWKAAPTGIQTT